MTEEQISALIASDEERMQVLRAARSLNLPDWMIGAGFVRNAVWDHLHGYQSSLTPGSDIDLIYYDSFDTKEEIEKELDRKLGEKIPVFWSAKNQARMHTKHGRKTPYTNSVEALSEWVEVPTCIAVRLLEDDTLTLFAPHGINDLVNLIVRPTPLFKNNLDLFWDRVQTKQWQKKWPKLVILEK